MFLDITNTFAVVLVNTYREYLHFYLAGHVPRELPQVHCIPSSSLSQFYVCTVSGCCHGVLHRAKGWPELLVLGHRCAHPRQSWTAGSKGPLMLSLFSTSMSERRWQGINYINKPVLPYHGNFWPKKKKSIIKKMQERSIIKEKVCIQVYCHYSSGWVGVHWFLSFWHCWCQPLGAGLGHCWGGLENPTYKSDKLH